MSSRWDVSLVTIALMQNQFFDSSHEGPVLGYTLVLPTVCRVEDEIGRFIPEPETLNPKTVRAAPVLLEIKHVVLRLWGKGLTRVQTLDALFRPLTPRLQTAQSRYYL